MFSTAKIKLWQIYEHCLSTKIFYLRYPWKIHPGKYFSANEASFTAVVIALTECFVTYTTDSHYSFWKFCIFLLTWACLVLRDIFLFMFGNPGWINIRISSFGSLIFFYLNKLLIESALKLKLCKLCENKNFAGMQNREMNIGDIFFIFPWTLLCVVCSRIFSKYVPWRIVF